MQLSLKKMKRLGTKTSYFHAEGDYTQQNAEGAAILELLHKSGCIIIS